MTSALGARFAPDYCRTRFRLIHQIHRHAVLPVPLERVYPFFADAGNLVRLTPPELRFRFVTPLPIEMKEGALIDYRLRLFGVPFGWRTRIDAWEPGLSFVDRQVRGPFKRWVHTHHFAAVSGGTEMIDRVDWELPVQPIGEIARPLVRAQLERIFDFRSRAMNEVIAAGEL